MPEMNAPESNSTPPSNHVPKAMLWVVIVAIIAIALVVLMVFWMNQDETVAPSANPAAKSGTATESTVDAGAFTGWNTCEWEQYGITLKYPSGWTCEKKSDEKNIEGKTALNFLFTNTDKTAKFRIGFRPKGNNDYAGLAMTGTGAGDLSDISRSVDFGAFSLQPHYLTYGGRRTMVYWGNATNNEMKDYEYSFYFNVVDSSTGNISDVDISTAEKMISSIEVNSDTVATDTRTTLTSDNYDRFCTKGDDCQNKFKNINKDESNTTVRYSNSDLGIAFDVPYNTSWINDQYKLNPYDSAISSTGDTVLYFGPMGLNCEGICAISRRHYSLRIIQPESAEKVMQRYSGINLYGPEVVFIGGLKAVKYAETAMGDGYYVEVVGTKHNYIFEFSDFGVDSGSDAFAKVENIVKSVDLID